MLEVMGVEQDRGRGEVGPIFKRAVRGVLVGDGDI